MTRKSIFKAIAIIGLLYSTTIKGQINPTNNFIGVDVSTFPQNTSFNYDSCFALGMNLGMGSIGLFQNWTAIETAPYIYNMTIMDIANYYYPAHNMPVDLTITPIHTNNLEVPSDLTTMAFNDLILINRFKTLLDSVKAHIPNVISFDLKNIEIKIYNQLGQIEKIISNINNRNIRIETFDLSDGLYFLTLKNEAKQLNRKFIINK